LFSTWNAFQIRNKAKGFTLSEVLITLGIIGVVASMTLPTLIAKYNKKQTAIAVKAAYSMLSQAILQSVADNGDTKYWTKNLSSKQYYDKYLKKYLSFTSEMDINDVNQFITYKYINGRTITDNSLKEKNSYLGILKNGTFIYVNNEYNYTATIMVDINGLKKPNQIGIDLFHFVILDNKLYPWGYKGTINSIASDDFGLMDDRNKLITPGARFACNKINYGRWCTALLMLDGWEFKDDYPW